MNCLKIIFALTIFTLFNAQASDPRSGPDLSGISIPQSVDRLVSTEELKNVQNKCFKEKILKPLLLNFSPNRLDFLDNKNEYPLSSEIKASSSGFRFSVATDSYLNSPISSPIMVKYKGKDHQLSAFSTLFSTRNFDFNLFEPESHYNHTILIIIHFYNLDQNQPIKFTLESSIPLLVFAPGRDVEAFGELGEVSPKFIVSDIRIAGIPSKNEKIYSSVTRQLTSLTLNTENYVDCLKSELANLP